MIPIYLISYISVVLMVALCAINLIQYPQKIKVNTIMIGLIVFVIAFAFEYKGTPDIYRYYQQLSYLSNLPFSKALSYDNSGMYVFNAFAWLISKTGIPQLLPAITSATVYSITTYISSDFAIKNGNSKYVAWIVFLQLLFLPLFQIMSNIRNVFSFSLILYAAYEDVIKKRRGIDIVLLYILPCFIHNSAFVLVAFRLLAFVSQRMLIIVAIIATFASSIITQVYSRFFGRINLSGYLGQALNTSLDRAYHYINGVDTSLYSAAVQTSRYHKFARGITFVSASLLLYLSYKYIKNVNNKKENKLFGTYIFLLCISTLASNIFAAPNYWRFFTAATIGMGIIITFYINRNNSILERLVLYTFYSMGLFTTLVHVYGNNSFVDVKMTGSNLLTTNVYTIIIKLLGALFT